MIVGEMTENTNRVFLWTGLVSHLVDPRQPLPPGTTAGREPALCGIRPVWPSAWFGTDENLDNTERANLLPLCKTCAVVKGALESDSA